MQLCAHIVTTFVNDVMRTYMYVVSGKMIRFKLYNVRIQVNKLTHVLIQSTGRELNNALLCTIVLFWNSSAFVNNNI